MVIPQHSVCKQSIGNKLDWVPAQHYLVKSILSRWITTAIWSPIVFQNGYRSGEHFGHADWLVLDFDSGDMTLAEAENTWCDVIHIIGTTKSHQKEKNGAPPCDRFRVAMLFEHRITDRLTYEYNLDHYISKYGSDVSCKDSAHGFFPCEKITSINRDLDDAYRIDVKKPPPGWGKLTGVWDGRPLPLSRFAQTVIAGSEVKQLEPSRNVVCWRVAKDLIKAGYSADDAHQIIINQVNFVPPLDDRVIRQRVKSAMKSLEREIVRGQQKK